jgi:plastocyanin
MDRQTLQPPKRLLGRGPSARAARWLALGGIALAVLFVPLPAGPEPADRTIRIEASSFAFAPGQVEVNRGDRLTFELVAQDVVHGLYVDGYGIQMRAEPGQIARLTFTADRSGTFRLRCSVTCGPLHPFMIGKLAVGPNLPLWRGVALASLAGIFGLWTYRR